MRNNKFYIGLLASVLAVTEGQSQTSVVQDVKGETSLALGKAGVVAINAKDESLSFSYGISLDKRPAGDNAPALSRFNYFGISAKAKGKSGLANIIKNDDFQYDGSIGVFYFQDIEPPAQTDNSSFQWYVNTDFLFSQFKVYNTASAFSEQVKDQHTNGYKVTGGINLSRRLTNKVPLIMGLAINGGHKNNTADLKTADVALVSYTQDPVTLQTRIIEKDKTSAYNQAEFKNSLAYSNLNMDIGGQFANRFLLLIHPRWSMQKDRNPQFNPGAGLYVTKAGAPLEVVAGIQLQVLDYANTAGSIKSRGERTVVNVVAGFTF